MKNGVKKLLKAFFIQILKLLSWVSTSVDKSRSCIFFGNPSDEEKLSIAERFAFYLPSASLSWARWADLTLLAKVQVYISGQAIFLFEHLGPGWDKAMKYRDGAFFIDYRANPQDGWEWVYATNYLEKLRIQSTILDSSKSNFVQMVHRLKALKPERTYLFGTGPSLEQATLHDWKDGLRVVCNTIVRDKQLFDFIDPHFLVAGDAIYHFGHTEFAKAFRTDLYQRMKESPRFQFVYPQIFDAIVRREFGSFSDRLVPIPQGQSKEVGKDLTVDFALPAMGNALALLLLPLGCTLTKEVCLWGFDGRAPKDALFWSNSTKQSYSELLPTLQAAHPAFFSHHVPATDPGKYVRTVLGEDLEAALSMAETKGWKFRMLHFSWTPALQKRTATPTEKKIANY